MAIQSTPPIQLDPSMDNGHQLAFINQNFQSIANVLQQNSFVIVSSGSGSIPVPNPMTPSQVITATAFHNLGIVPAFLVYGNIPTGGGYLGAGQLTTLPAQLYGTIGSSFGQVVAFMQARADTSAIYIDVINPSAINVPNLGSPWTFKFYILQATAT